MGTSTFDDLTGWATLVTAAMAALILVWYLLKRPPLQRTTKLALLFGIGVFPLGSAILGNYHGFEESRNLRFCGGCHVMKPYTNDVTDPKSTTLASMHGRNAAFGDAACFECHRNYGMFGTITTKLAGMRHAFLYAKDYRNMDIPEFLKEVQLRAPFPNSNCMQCHSTYLPKWSEVPEHDGLAQDARDGKVSCASEGCHGPAHPFSKAAKAAAGIPTGVPAKPTGMPEAKQP